MKKNILVACALTLIWTITYAQHEWYLQSGIAVHVLGHDTVNPTLFIDGSIITDSGSLLTNTDGILEIKKNLLVRGIITSTGIDKFSGSGNQTLLGNLSGTCYLGNIIKNNAGNIIITHNIDMRSLAFRTNGTIDISGGSIVCIKNTQYNSLSGFDSSRYIDVGTTGSLKLQVIDTINNHPYSFPLGNCIAGYKRININLSSLGATGTSFISGTLVNGSPGSVSFSKHYSTGFSGNTNGPCLIGINDQWIIFDCLQDNFWSFSGPSDYCYTVKAYATSCGPGPSRVIQSPSGTGAWSSHIENTIGTITDNLCQYTDWSNGSVLEIPGGTYQGFEKDFAITSSSSIILPVELTRFNVYPINNEFMRLGWSTHLEIDNDIFIIQRSIDGTTFVDIGEISGNGTTTTVTDYIFDDHDIVSGITYYYRLQQIDNNHIVTMSNIISGYIKSNRSIWSCYPNPNQGVFTVTTTSQTPYTAILSIRNIIGQLVHKEYIICDTGTYRKTISTDIPNGIYNVKITSERNDTLITQKIIVAR